MIDRQRWKETVQNTLQDLYAKQGGQDELAPVVVQVPPKPEMGDLAFPLFPYAKAFRKAPNVISEELTQAINAFADKPDGQAFAAGPARGHRRESCGV